MPGTVRSDILLSINGSNILDPFSSPSLGLYISHLLRLPLVIEILQFNYIRTKKEYPSLLLDLVSACHNRLALIVTTSISFEEWGDALGNPSITQAIVDRLFDHAGIINIRPGRSYRTEGPNAPKQYQPDEHTS